jgi:AcrR family transcriptional regulator
MDNLLLLDERPKRADSQENHALLLRTAQRLFTEQGVEHVTMSAIAEAAGVGKGTLYRHFANKVAVIQAMLDEDQRDFQARTFAYLGSFNEPREQLRWFMREAFGFVSRNLALLAADEAGTCSMLDHPAHTWWRQTIRGLLARTSPALDADYVTDTLYVMLDPRTIAYQHNARGYSSERILSGLVALVDHLTI